jgi:iron transport multicopper oxidase
MYAHQIQHAFDVVRSAGSSSYNFVNPVRRDVVSLGGGSDNVTIRFTTDNAGPWCVLQIYNLFLDSIERYFRFFHCHIDPHKSAYVHPAFIPSNSYYYCL